MKKVKKQINKNVKNVKNKGEEWRRLYGRFTKKTVLSFC